MAKRRDDFSFTFSKGNTGTLKPPAVTADDPPVADKPETREEPVGATGGSTSSSASSSWATSR